MVENFSEHFKKPVKEFAKGEFALLFQGASVGDTLDMIRREGLPEGVVYFYVGDTEGRLIGVLPSRRLLTAPLEKTLSELMIRHVISIPEQASLLDACELFVLYKLLAIPLVDTKKHITGVVDISFFTEEILSFNDQPNTDEVFQTIGFHVKALRHASIWKSFRYRLPWLLATIMGGILCAMVASHFAPILEGHIVFALFMTLVLGLGESISTQSTALALQQLHSVRLTGRWFLAALKKEFFVASLLSFTCGIAVSILVYLSKGDNKSSAIAIGCAILASMVCACLIGVGVPSLLRILQLDPRVASGPLALTLTDVCTLFCYFSVVQYVL